MPWPRRARPTVATRSCCRPRPSPWSAAPAPPSSPSPSAERAARPASAFAGDVLGGDGLGPAVVGLARRRALDLVDQHEHARHLVAGDAGSAVGLHLVELRYR